MAAYIAYNKYCRLNMPLYLYISNINICEYLMYIHISEKFNISSVKIE